MPTVSTHNVFLSWSQPRSLEVAKTLSKWLPLVIQAVKPWLSELDIQAGTRWAPAIADQLAMIKMGIVCVTPENADAPWLNFEAGALSKAIGDDMRLFPYCHDLKRTQLANPMAQFQTIESNREGTLKLVQSINAALGFPVPENALETTFDKFWIDIEKDLKSIQPLKKKVPERTDKDMLEEVVDGLRSLQLDVYRLSRGPQSNVVVEPVATRSGSDPQAFGRYRVRARLAEGGMSEIYLADASGIEGFSRTFVLKRLRPALARDRDVVAIFIDEARTQSRLVHSNIVPVFDFGMVDDEYFMTQEYIVGRDLTHLIQRHHDQTGQPIDPRVAYYVAYETLQALAYAHSKCDNSGVPLNIVHRDVSPGNIIVSVQGEVKLSDFGIARADRRFTISQVGMVKGNTNLMSPEQARGQSLDARSDLFSLGGVLYYCLTNEFLYGGENDLDVLFKAAVGPSQDGLRRFRSLPSPAGQILEKALAFDPEARFQSAAEFAEALAPHIAGGKAQTISLMMRLFGKELGHQAR
jgi:tRNA A-37 threonylcarbamoyl transferase component Bud32